MNQIVFVFVLIQYAKRQINPFPSKKSLGNLLVMIRFDHEFLSNEYLINSYLLLIEYNKFFSLLKIVKQHSPSCGEIHGAEVKDIHFDEDIVEQILLLGKDCPKCNLRMEL